MLRAILLLLVSPYGLTLERTPGFTFQAFHPERTHVMDEKTPEVSIGKRIAWTAGIACVACCAIPSLGIAIGSASIGGLAIYSEKAAAAIAVIGLGFWIFKRLTRRSGPACDIDGSCRPNPSKSESKRKT
jgi:hypothetical protein